MLYENKRFVPVPDPRRAGETPIQWGLSVWGAEVSCLEMTPLLKGTGPREGHVKMT